MHRVTEFVVNLFTPTKKNNYHPKALHPQYLTSYLLYALLLTFLLSKFATPLSNVLGFATDISQEKLYQLTNEKRKEHSLASLNLNTQLSQAAAHKAQDMFRKNYWAHFGPSGETPWGFILDSGYKYEYAGENLAKNFLFSDGVIDAWMNSPTHRENILRSEYTDVGFAIANGTLNGEETTLVVQMFGKPLQSTATVTQVKAATQENLQPTLLPTIAVSPQTAVAASASNLVAADSNGRTTFKNFSWNINIIFICFILIALILDVVFSMKLRILHINRKSLAHAVFIIFILVGIFILGKGAILQGAKI